MEVSKEPDAVERPRLMHDDRWIDPDAVVEGW
jgi:hypothetical protein